METVKQVIRSHLLSSGKNRHAIILWNGRGEELGFNPEYYVSHRISDAEDWIPTWVLPAEGAPAPPREA